MKTKKLSLSFLLLVSLFVFIACESDKDVDLTKPAIKLNTPAEGAVLLIGDENGICFDADFEDDIMLSSYKIDIHNNFNDHDHSHTHSLADSDIETVAFSFEKTYDISGKRNAHIHHHDIKIPANATPGKYHLVIYCSDEATNETFIARNIVLSHDGEGSDHDR